MRTVKVIPAHLYELGIDQRRRRASVKTPAQVAYNSVAAISLQQLLKLTDTPLAGGVSLSL